MQKILLSSLFLLAGSSIANAGSPQGLSEGHNVGCAIGTTNNQLYCWGDNTYGTMGDGTVGGSHTTPQAVPGEINIAQVSVSGDDDVVCDVNTSGQVKCWGHNQYGQIGDGSIGVDKHTPTLVAALPSGLSAKFVSTGGDHSCAIDTGNTGFCWGDNSHGQLNLGNLTSGHITPTAFNPVANFPLVELSTNRFITCTVENNGGGYNEAGCAGINDRSQQGAGPGHADRLIVNFGSHGVFGTIGVPAKHVAAGYDHVCATNVNDKMYCWGDNDNGEVGDGTITERTAPTPVAVIPGSMGTALVAKVISLGTALTCAATQTTLSGSKTVGMFCWGRGDHGQMGTGTQLACTGTTACDKHVPFQQPGSNNTYVGTISEGGYQSCGLWSLSAGIVGYCDGSNNFGQLGNGSLTDKFTPTAVNSPGTGW